MLKESLQRTGQAFGSMAMEFLTPGLPAIIAATGAEFGLFDMEHTGASLETMKMLIAGSRGVGLAPLVRVPRGEYHFIARALDISVHTAKFHVTAILDKLGARNRADAVSIILREGLVAI